MARTVPPALAITGAVMSMTIPAQAAETTVSPPAASRRIIYPAARLPSLRLPNGERQTVRSLLDVQQPMRFGSYVWDDRGVPQGPVWMRVDLGLQTISVFRAGHEIGSAVILYGADRKPTPPGVYPILARARHHRSNLYDAPMPYMLRLTGDGIAIHASNVRARAATHGCIGVPPEFARLLFAQARRGDRVAIVGVPQA
ncbi:L,D-transpeptidase family protein [uncultured Novosphingobium sp.]|uniref:L,D-transpeptidase family protein n=1 Tax=uncultured Novosphingobium sp. TaxID=292277 RepID=UPI00258B2BC2|nr:L,D-transpeptidase family protein [uncultured Novosphingobium sp.]